MKETYISIDVEADGPIPGDNSLMSIGAAAYDEQGSLLGTYSENFLPHAGAKPDPKTMEWWAKHPEAYVAATTNRSHPESATRRFHKWLSKFSKPVFVGAPVTYDFMWVYWYLIHYVGHCPASFSGIDIKTMAMIALEKPYRESTKRNMPKSWFSAKIPHTHVGIDDAKEQGSLFFAIRDWLRERVTPC